MSNPPQSFKFKVGMNLSGIRLDTGVSNEIEHCSRSFAASLIRLGKITVDGLNKKPGYILKPGEIICGKIDPPEVPRFEPENIPLDILYEDPDLVAVNKAPGMVVHPAPGHPKGTLANALAHHCPDLTGISGSLRPGIVHRLDKDTSGVIVVAKNSHAMLHLAEQFKSRRVRKRYLALVYGNPQTRSGSIDLPIGRHPTDRKKMSVHTRSPRPALTYWQVLESFAGISLLELDIRTGRTHQIRVHCQAMGHPVVGDPVYGNRGATKQLAAISADSAKAIKPLQRQMLHAQLLCISHPATERSLSFEAPLPADMLALITWLKSPNDC